MKEEVNNTINIYTEILYTLFKYNCKMHNNTYNPMQAIENLEVKKRKKKIWNIEEFISYLSKYEHNLIFRISFNS